MLLQLVLVSVSQCKRISAAWVLTASTRRGRTDAATVRLGRKYNRTHTLAGYSGPKSFFFFGILTSASLASPSLPPHVSPS